jgi:hypothetical protein
MVCRGCAHFRDYSSDTGYYCAHGGELTLISKRPAEPKPIPSCPWYDDDVEDE